MKVYERLQVLSNNECKVKHKLMNNIELQDGFDLIRIRGIKPGKTNKNYCEFLYAEKFIKNEINQKINDDLLNKEIEVEEVWIIGGHCALDMYVNIK